MNPTFTRRKFVFSSAKGFLLSLLCFRAKGMAQSTVPRPEGEVKAGFLFHFLQFVEWPNEVMEKTPGVYRIGIVGNDPFGKLLDELVEGETPNQRKIQVLRFGTTEPRIYCHIFFIPASENARMQARLRYLKDKQALLVSDAPGFVEIGGMIELVKKENKIRLRINLQAVRDAGITISSRLLRLAEVIGQKPSE